MHPSATLIASLVYARFPSVDFPCFVDELGMALGGTCCKEGEANAIFEVAGARIVVGFEDHRRQPADFRKLALGAEASMVLTIGPGPQADTISPLEHHRHVLLSALAERINRSYPCEFILWSEADEVFEPADYAPLVSMSAFSNAKVPSWPDMALPDVPRLRQERLALAPPIKSLIRKLEALELGATFKIADATPDSEKFLAEVHDLNDLVRPSRAFLTHQRGAFANSQPQIPEPNLSEMQKIRAALLAAPPAEADGPDRQPSLPQRLTIYSMNATLMLVALPVGCGVLVYNMVRGEDLRFSARAIAMTSTLVGLAQLAGLENALNLV